MEPRRPDYPRFFPSSLLPILLIAILTGLWACTPANTGSSDSRNQLELERQTKSTPGSPPATDLRLSGEELELTPAEPDLFLERELAGLRELGDWEPGKPMAGKEPATAEIVYDFPVVHNKQVQFYLDYFQGELRPTFSRWLANSGRYVPMIRERLRQAGLPEDLAYLPMIESGYSLTAYSRARAVGPWQFMAPTARQYGLSINEYIDERRDPVRSTEAAIAFLSDLYNEFGCWHLATAAYNAGNGRIRGALRRFEADNFWDIARHNHLALETRHYVPKLIAAIIIARNPEAYGFENITYEEPLRYETIEVPRWTSLEAVALAGGLELDELHDLNHQLRRLVTPPEAARYSLRLPEGSKRLVAEKLPRVRAVAEVDYRTHVVQRGESLSQISQRYNINQAPLRKTNNLRSDQLNVGQRLRVPVQRTNFRLLTAAELAADGNRRAGGQADGLVLHTVQPGESLWVISQRYGVDSRTIAAWNGLDDPSRIRAGQQLALYFAPAPSPATRTATAESKQAPTTTDRRNLTTVSAKQAPKAPKPEITYYQVRGGDTLWSIARKFQTTTDLIREWNQLNGDLIHPGERLVLLR